MKSNEETLGNAAFKYSNKFMNNGERYHGFIAGAEWQAKRRYSDEEVLNLLDFINDRLPDLYSRFSSEEELKEWFEQFKKK